MTFIVRTSFESRPGTSQEQERQSRHAAVELAKRISHGFTDAHVVIETERNGEKVYYNRGEGFSSVGKGW